MGKKEKLLARLQARPKDFSWSELQNLMRQLGYMEIEGRGSRRKFMNTETKRIVSLHKRHPDDTLLDYQVRDVLNFIEEQGDI